MQPGGRREAEFDRWWRKITDGVWVLEPAVEARSVVCPYEISGLYYVTTNTPETYYLLDIAKAPPDTRGWFPVLPIWRTAKELDGMPTWTRFLYRMDHDKGELVLTAAMMPWSVGAEEE
jgi:hypothetical protein